MIQNLEFHSRNCLGKIKTAMCTEYLRGDIDVGNVVFAKCSSQSASDEFGKNQRWYLGNLKL